MDTIITGAITGIGSGIGTSIGVWISQRAFIKHLEVMEKRLEKVKKRR
jgi:hypothetical protein